MSKERVFIKVSGIVQGVGFRPFVYNLALSLNLKGWVNNNSEGVYIDLEGDKEALVSFLDKLENNPPPLSRIENIHIEAKPLSHFKEFLIHESERQSDKITLISPDIAICKDCEEDISDPHNRRYGYPFTNCTNCGPRFSIIKSIPYDRDKTTMKKFPMCKQCHDEYTNPLNRRFHAQPNACDDCGPSIFITDSLGGRLEITSKKPETYNLEVIRWTAAKLKEGKIFAIKGLTGFHLCCDAVNEQAVNLLRQRKKRPFKPFAVMAKDLDTVKKICHTGAQEENLLSGIRKPIVLLKQNCNYNLPYSIAPNQKTLGVMLPYTPLHKLLFNEGVDILVMTSANYFGLPLEYDNEMALEHLSSIVDYFLMHDRDIYTPVDDSVTKVVLNKEAIIRRARGYAPDPVKYPKVHEILACGPNMKNTFAISKEGFVFLSQHIGDLENLETIQHYERNIDHFKNIFSFTPKYVAHDLHPGYSSTEYAHTYAVQRIPIQHHHAHIASCMVENNLKHKVIGISFDGTGYGTDGKIWGSEFLICDLLDFKRVAHLDYIKIPGGEKAIKEPWRMATAYLHKMSTLQEFYDQFDYKEILSKLYGDKALALLPVISSGLNSPETSSMGRLFDAASSLIGINDTVTYEGQASIELEAAIEAGISDSYSFKIVKKDEEFIIEPYKILYGIIQDRLSGIRPGVISSKFHNSIINLAIEMCCLLRECYSLSEVALAGGVFQNSYLLENLDKGLQKLGFKVYNHNAIPSNDGGIALGQIAIANEKINKGLI